jgi:hypothetical protein
MKLNYIGKLYIPYRKESCQYIKSNYIKVCICLFLGKYYLSNYETKNLNHALEISNMEKQPDLMDVSILPCLIFLIHLTHMHVVIIFVKPCK